MIEHDIEETIFLTWFPSIVVTSVFLFELTIDRRVTRPYPHPVDVIIIVIIIKTNMMMMIIIIIHISSLTY